MNQQTKSMSANPTKPISRPKNWLLTKSRRWHTWGGLIAGLFLLIIATSGIVLNYKPQIFSALGLEKKFPKPEKIKHAGTEKSDQPEGALSQFITSASLASLPVSMERAIEIARVELGDVPLEKIELKAERGELIYKLKEKDGDELWVSALTGSHFVKGEYERIGKSNADDSPMRQRDWGKILIDLHTGKIGGEVGKAVMSFAALLLLLLTLSGVYMWMKPIFIRRKNAQAQSSVPLRPRAAPVVAHHAVSQEETVVAK
jgi:uncharacterized iron-regulated membrane protein